MFLLKRIKEKFNDKNTSKKKRQQKPSCHLILENIANKQTNKQTDDSEWQSGKHYKIV